MSQPIKLVSPSTEETSVEGSRRQTLALRQGETLELDILQAHDGLELHSETRPLTLTISMGVEGPKVELSHASLKLKSTGRLELEAEHLDLKGTQSCTVKTGGDAEVRADGELRLQSTKDCVVRADVIHLN